MGYLEISDIEVSSSLTRSIFDPPTPQ